MSRTIPKWAASKDREPGFDPRELYPDQLGWPSEPASYEHGKGLEIGRKRKKAARISPDEFKVLLDCCKYKDTGYYLWLLFESGARAKEILDLTPQDIEFREDYAIIIVRRDVRSDRKGGMRAIPVFKCVPILRKLTQDRPPTKKLFWFKYITVHRRLSNIMKRAKEKGLVKTIKFHSFRHNAASRLLSQGMSEQNTKKLFGWRPDSQMLNTYSHIHPAEIINALKEINGTEKQPYNLHPEPTMPEKKDHELDYDSLVYG